MTSDAMRPSGDEATQARRPTDRDTRATAEPLVGGPRAATKFVGRVSQLDIAAVRTALQVWRQAMRAESDAWFAAERAAGQAVLTARRTVEQEVLLGHLAESVLRKVWYRGASGEAPETPEERVGATEASGQYVTALAMLALLVRDHLAPHEFALLYRPFVTLIPLEELGRE